MGAGKMIFGVGNVVGAGRFFDDMEGPGFAREGLGRRRGPEAQQREASTGARLRTAQKRTPRSP